jgi:hypothetical protein
MDTESGIAWPVLGICFEPNPQFFGGIFPI